MFEWDDENIAHIAEHAVSTDEAEEVFADPRRRGVAAYNTRAERRWAVVGSTKRRPLAIRGLHAPPGRCDPHRRCSQCQPSKSTALPPKVRSTMPRRAKLIPVDRQDIPEFKTESEEAKFWATHDLGPGLEAEMRLDFDPDLPSADEVRKHLVERQRDRAERTQPVPIRFDADVLLRLRALAAHKHTGYQTLLKTFVTERLYEEEKREGLV